MKNILQIIFVMICFTLFAPKALKAPEASVSHTGLFDEVCHIVEQHFFDAAFIQKKISHAQKDIRYCKGKDIQLEQAITFLVEALVLKRPSESQ